LLFPKFTEIVMTHQYIQTPLFRAVAIAVLSLPSLYSMSTFAATCPFDGGGSDAINDGMVLTRYALDIRGAPMTASTRYASLDPLQVQNNIECVGCALDMNGDGAINSVDATIIARHLAGFSGVSLTNGLNLGTAPSASRPTTAAITSFLASGCAVGGAINAFTQGGNAFGVPAVLGTTDGQPLTLGIGGGDGLRIQRGAAGGAINVIIGGQDNSVGKICPPLPGGLNCVIAPAQVYAGNVSGGNFNVVTDTAGSVGGGVDNRAGNNNALPDDAAYATVAGGFSNRANGTASAIGGGRSNSANGNHSIVGGGAYNFSEGFASTVPGGDSNFATGDYSFAAGSDANAIHNRAFVWGGNPAGPTNSAGVSTFTSFAQNGYYFYGGTSAGKSCVYVPDSNNGWQCTSDRNAKTNIAKLDGKSMLAKVAAMPVSSWSFIGGEAFKQVGPMAQDFFAAFRLGNDDKSISPMNMSGVALAAIQGLNQLVKEKDTEIVALKVRLKAIEKKLGL
jgi:Chaperone of endosialidase